MARGEVQSFEAYTQGGLPVIIVDYYDTRHAASAMSLLREMHMNVSESLKKKGSGLAKYHRNIAYIYPRTTTIATNQLSRDVLPQGS